VSSGYEADGAALHENFANGLSPASAVDLSETRALFVHGLGEDGHGYIGLLNTNGTPPTLMSSDVLPAAGLGSLADPSHPVVFAHNDGYRMVFSATATDGKIGLFLAESTDGFSWSVSHTPLLDDASSWHAAAKFGRSIEWTDEGAMRLWYSGSNGSRLRIGSAIWDEASGQFSPEPAATTDWIFGTGVPGQFDDSHVSDPMVFQFDGQTHLLYSAFNGETWYIGHATRSEDGSFERSLNGQGLIRPVLSGQSLTFSHDGADSPVVWTEDGSLSIWYAGHEGDVAEGSGTRRLGVATGQPTALFANQKVPTAGDTLFFDTSRSDNDTQVIELSQRIEAFTTASSGASGLRLDAERGFLYVTAKGNNYIYVIDIRDDSTDTFADRNYLDIEALISIESNVGSRGFRDVIAPPGTGLLYAAAQRPDAILVFDLSSLEDNADKEVYRDLAIGSLPLQPSSGNGADQGEETGLSFSERFGGGQMALSESGLLLVTQFLDNSVSIFDLAGGDLGSEVAYLPHVGENPYAVAISPDGHYAVVANYLGKELDNGAHSSTLLVIDINPESPTFLTPLTWISNR
jgi:6-phosphogluconolactonase (cycloisomerase 2 family)